MLPGCPVPKADQTSQGQRFTQGGSTIRAQTWTTSCACGLGMSSPAGSTDALPPDGPPLRRQGRGKRSASSVHGPTRYCTARGQCSGRPGPGIIGSHSRRRSSPSPRHGQRCQPIREAGRVGCDAVGLRQPVNRQRRVARPGDRAGGVAGAASSARDCIMIRRPHMPRSARYGTSW